MNARVAFPWRAALLCAALFIGLGLVATAFEPWPADGDDVALQTAW